MGKLANKQKMSKAARAARCAKTSNTVHASTAVYGKVVRNEPHSIDLIKAIVADDLVAFKESSRILEETSSVSMFDAAFQINGVDPKSGKKEFFEGDLIELLDRSRSYKILAHVCKIGVLGKVRAVLTWTVATTLEYEYAQAGLDKQAAEHLRLLMHSIYEPWDVDGAHDLITAMGTKPFGPKSTSLILRMCEQRVALHEQQEFEASVGNPSPIELPSKARSL